MVATYEALRADIAAHAGGVLHAAVPEGVVVVQRSQQAAGLAAAHGGRRRGGAAGGGAAAAAVVAAAAGSRRVVVEIPGPVRVFRSGVGDATLAPRKYKLERRFGLPVGLAAVKPGRAAKPPGAGGVGPSSKLAAARLEELNARLLGADVDRSPPVADRLADVLSGATALAAVGAGRDGLGMRGGRRLSVGDGAASVDDSDAGSSRRQSLR